MRALRAERYDAALDFQGLWKSAAWARLCGAARVVGWERASRREPASSLLVTESVARSGGGHVIDKNLALLRPLGIEAVGLREFPLPFSAEAVARVDAGLSGLGDGGARGAQPRRRLGEQAVAGRALRRAGAGAPRLGLRPLVSWGPGEEALADRVVAASGGAAARSFPTTLLDYVELARRARLVVAADTGPLHLACAVGTPVVALFGPTDPARNGPFAPDDVVVRRTPPCAPCYSRTCARHAGVMDEIAVAEVLAAARGAPRRGAGAELPCPLGTASPPAGRWASSCSRSPSPRRARCSSGCRSRSSARRCGSGPRATSRRRSDSPPGDPTRTRATLSTSAAC